MKIKLNLLGRLKRSQRKGKIWLSIPMGKVSIINLIKDGMHHFHNVIFSLALFFYLDNFG